MLKDRRYTDFQLTKKDWNWLSIIHEVLRVRPCFLSCPSCPSPPLPPGVLYQERSNVQQTFSTDQMPTVWHITPALEFLIKILWHQGHHDTGGPQFEEMVLQGGQHVLRLFHMTWYVTLTRSHLFVLPQHPQLRACSRKKRPKTSVSGDLGRTGET